MLPRCSFLKRGRPRPVQFSYTQAAAPRPFAGSTGRARPGHLFSFPVMPYHEEMRTESRQAVVLGRLWRRALVLCAAAAMAVCGAEENAPPDRQPGFRLLSVLSHAGVVGAHDIEVRGGLAYVAGKANKPLGRRAGRFAIVDVADPASPAVRGMLSEADHPALHNAETVLLLDDVCLLGADALLAVDISDSAAPRITACVEHEQIERINGMVRWGRHVAAANKSGYLDVFDVSGPRGPVFAGALNTRKTGNLHSPHDIARFGRRYLVAPGAGKDVPVHFAVYEAADAEGTLRPVEGWRLAGVVSDPLLAGANRVVVDARYAYVACHYSNRVGVIDLRHPDAPELVATLPTAGAEPDGLALADGTLFVGAGKCVEAVDISRPARPRPLAHFRGEPLFTLPREGREGNAHDLVVRGGLVYATAQRDGRIGILAFGP